MKLSDPPKSRKFAEKAVLMKQGSFVANPEYSKVGFNDCSVERETFRAPPLAERKISTESSYVNVDLLDSPRKKKVSIQGSNDSSNSINPRQRKLSNQESIESTRSIRMNGKVTPISHKRILHSDTNPPLSPIGN